MPTWYTSRSLVTSGVDSAQFQDKYYSQAGGGEKAAIDLQSNIRDYLKKVEPTLANLPTVVKAFANADGMSRFLLSAGLVQSPIALAEFAKGFSQAFATSDFVLVGHGKDRADKKIKGKPQKRTTDEMGQSTYTDRRL